MSISQSENTETCEIFFEPFNNNNNKQITCLNPKCNKSLCLDCCKKWLLQEGIAYTCPYCKTGWDWGFIYKNLPLSFINNELKKNYAEICSVINDQQYKHLHDIYKYYVQIYKFVDYYYKIDKLHLFVWQGYDNEYTRIDPTIFKTDLKYIYDIQEYNCMDPELKHYLKNGIYQCVSSYSGIYYNTYFYDLKCSGYLKIFLSYILINKTYNIDDIYNKYTKEYFYDIFKKRTSYISEEESSKYFKIVHKIIDQYITKTPIEIINNVIKSLKLLEIKESYNKYIEYQKSKNKPVEHQNIVKKKIIKCFKNGCAGDVYKYKTQLICDVCHSIFCIKCHQEFIPEFLESVKDDKIIQVKNPDFDEKSKHECKQEDINTVKLLTENIKNCPKCQEPIWKDGGCDHMWCSKCHTMFNWSDLKVTKTTTNPHYYAWLREQGLTPDKLNHPDAYGNQNYACIEQLNKEQCYKILKKYSINDKKFYKFADLIELKQKPMNDGSILSQNLKYYFNFITKEELKKHLSTLYISRYFIEQHNNIIINNVFLISEVFKKIDDDYKNNNPNNVKMNVNKIKDLSEYKAMINNVINTYNNSIKMLSQLYKNFNFTVLNFDDLDEKNNETPTINLIKNNVIQQHFITTKYKLLKYQPEYEYLISPLYGLEELSFDYVIVVLYEYYCLMNNIKINLNENMKIIVSSYPISEIFNKDILDLLFNKDLYEKIQFIDKHDLFGKIFNGDEINTKDVDKFNYICRIIDLKQYVKFTKDELKTFNIFKIYYNDFYIKNLNFDKFNKNINTFKEQTLLIESKYKDIIYNKNKTIKLTKTFIDNFITNLSYIKYIFDLIKHKYKEDYNNLIKNEIVDEDDNIIDFSYNFPKYYKISESYTVKKKK